MGLFGKGFLSDIVDVGLSAIPGVGSYIGTSAANESNQQIAANANEFNSAQAVANRDFQREMSNTAHQREMADLQKAGINPILAMNSGASSPTGSTASAVSIPKQGTNLDLSQAIHSSLDAMNKRQSLDNLKEQNKLTQAQLQKTDAEADVAKNVARDTDLMQRAREGNPFITGGDNKGHFQVPQYYKTANQATLNEYNAKSAEARRMTKSAEFQDKHNTLINILDTAKKATDIIPGIKLNLGK